MDPLVDQLYFANVKKANPLELDKSNLNKKHNDKPYSKTDYKLYRKDIYSLTKDILNKKNNDQSITYYFDQFIYHAIEYLKFKEKEIQIQEEYADLDMNSKSSHTFNTPQNNILNKIEESNMLMYKDYKLKTISMDQFVKKKKIKETPQPHLPTQKIIKHKTKQTKQTNYVTKDNCKEHSQQYQALKQQPQEQSQEQSQEQTQEQPQEQNNEKSTTNTIKKQSKKGKTMKLDW